MSWLQLRLAITPEQAESLEDKLLELGAVSVTFMDAEDHEMVAHGMGEYAGSYGAAIAVTSVKTGKSWRLRLGTDRGNYDNVTAMAEVLEED